ncbi:hypothetical protein BUALT_Bualt07G0017000 [Buddleja alternifolia]|uniref:Tf2-1-like SH3-like domain-containing protein n=1 Tax=Buddleja alternifolia TaxID=168488 RepID=A0AAV6X8N8_9LAMI|nr:hypothetical protein BUALT_Bualt07G0017000 [Buddleja alternifolia]
MAKSWAEQSDLAKSFLEKARRKMKKWADPKRRHLEFNTGNKVLIKLIPQQFKAFRGMHKGLVRKYEGPYPVVAKVGKVSYRLDLPGTLKIHPVFHVSMLRPYQEDEEDPSRGESHRAPPVVTKSFDKEIEEVLSHKVVRRRGVKPTTHYFIKWKGLPESRGNVGIARRLVAAVRNRGAVLRQTNSPNVALGLNRGPGTSKLIFRTHYGLR